MKTLALALPVVEDGRWPLLLVGLCGCILVFLFLWSLVVALRAPEAPASADAGPPPVPPVSDTEVQAGIQVRHPPAQRSVP